MYGQLNGREERIRETAEWLGATPQTPAGQPNPADSALDMDRVLETVEAVRNQLAVTTETKIEVFAPDEYFRQTVQAMLLPWELACVSFVEPHNVCR